MKLKVVQWVLALLLLAPCTQAQSIWDATHLANVKQFPFHFINFFFIKTRCVKLCGQDFSQPTLSHKLYS